MSTKGLKFLIIVLFLFLAMLISNYVTEHPNREQQAQWQSCLSAIVTDCHKSQNVSREEMQQLGNKIMNYFGVYSFDATFLCLANSMKINRGSH